LFNWSLFGQVRQWLHDFPRIFGEALEGWGLLTDFIGTMAVPKKWGESSAGVARFTAEMRPLSTGQASNFRRIMSLPLGLN
jgi:hypothetical protein